jgi:hypothetical protein
MRHQECLGAAKKNARAKRSQNARKRAPALFLSLFLATAGARETVVTGVGRADEVIE